MNLFRRIQPNKTFHITIESVAKLLGIPPEMIVRIERWENVLFIHRRDIGGQFLSYRKLQNWPNAVNSKVKNCHKQEKLLVLWLAIKNDGKKYAKQYEEAYYVFVERVCQQQWSKLLGINNPRGLAMGG